MRGSSPEAPRHDLSEPSEPVDAASEAVHVASGPHPDLDPETPAWAEDGRIVVAPRAFVLPPTEQAELVQHELIHVIQQRFAPVEETPAARDRAERLADRPLGDLPSPRDLQAPAPRLLAAPVTGKQAEGFARLFAGADRIIGEVVDGGVTVRAERSFTQLKIEAPTDPKSQFGAKTMTDLQFLACGKKSFASLKGLATKMRAVAKRVAGVNDSISKGSRWRVELVLVVSEESRLHEVDGKPLITISHEDFDHSGPETAAHEASLFESHTHPKDPSALAPDAFALRFADLFGRLAKTTGVPLPTDPFSKSRRR